MARILTAGFEHNTMTTGVEWALITGTPTIQSGITYSPGFAMNANPGVAAITSVRTNMYTANQFGPVYISFRFRVDTYPSALTGILNMQDNVSNIGSRVSLSTTGVLSLRTAGNAIIGGTAQLELGRWYQVEVMHDSTNTPGQLELKLDGSIVASGNNSLRGGWARAVFGILAAATGNLYFDDIIINDNTGAYENTYPGHLKLAFITPNAAGDANQWNNTANAAGSSNNYLLVDEMPPNDATDMVQSGTLDNTDMYNFSNPGLVTGDVIRAVELGARFRNNVADATTAFRLQIAKQSAGTIAQSASIIPNSTAWRTNQPGAATGSLFQNYLDPDSMPWTPAALENLQGGIKIAAANVNRIQVSTMWGYISYIPKRSSLPNGFGAFF